MQQQSRRSRSLTEIIEAMPRTITGRQIKAARIMATLTRAQLAMAAGLSEGTVIKHEQRDEAPITAILETRLSLTEALYQAGVVLGDNERVERIGAA